MLLDMELHVVDALFEVGDGGFNVTDCFEIRDLG